MDLAFYVLGSSCSTIRPQMRRSQQGPLKTESGLIPRVMAFWISVFAAKPQATPM